MQLTDHRLHQAADTSQARRWRGPSGGTKGAQPLGSKDPNLLLSVGINRHALALPLPTDQTFRGSARFVWLQTLGFRAGSVSLCAA